jgi:hypothetical protein
MVRESGRLGETGRKSSPNDIDRGLLEYPTRKSQATSSSKRYPRPILLIRARSQICTD